MLCEDLRFPLRAATKHTFKELPRAGHWDALVGGGKEKELKKKNEGRASITLTFLLKPGKVYSGRAGGRGSLLQRIRLKKPSVPTPARHSRGFPRQPPGEEPARTFFIPYPTIPVPKSTPGVIFPWMAGPNTQQRRYCSSIGTSHRSAELLLLPTVGQETQGARRPAPSPFPL